MIIPLIVLVGLAIAATWYMVLYLSRLRRKVRIETIEALDILRREFTAIDGELTKQEAALIESRKTKKLTGAEQSMLLALRKALTKAEENVEKEIKDVASLTNQSE